MNNKTISDIKHVLYLSGLLMLVLPAHATSFDCGKAQSKVEHMICDNPEISKFDDDLAASYKAAVQDQSKAEKIKQTQKLWMKMRNGCDDAVCVKNLYQHRIEQLNPDQDATTQPQTSATPMQTARPTATSETACLAPKIDWRNYEWTLITGKGETVCEEMMAYLKSRPADIAPPTCPEERLPGNGNWTRPESRVLSEEERQVILREMPEKFRHMPVGVSYERWISGSKLLRVIRGDITRDGIPESLLAYASGEGLAICESSKRCAREEEIFKGGIVLFSDSYNLLPMNDAGTQVNWLHPTFSHTAALPLLKGGELIYYKGQPYWLTGVMWSQHLHDDFAHNSTRPSEPNSKIFGLFGVGHYVIGQYGGPLKPAPFSEVQNLRGEGAACVFGYFHRDNLKQNPAKKGK